MPAYRFPKPHPLSPDTKTWTENGVRYKKDKGGRGGKSVVTGVETKRSIYYWWYEYLRLSKLYQKRCGIQVKLSEEEVRRYPKWKKENGDAIFRDFGNIFEYDNLFSGDSEESRQRRFWKWWSDGNRGGKLFGVQAVGADWVDEADVPTLLKDEAIKLFAVETTLTKTEIRRRFNRLLKGIEVSPVERRPKYWAKNPKVDVPSLFKCWRVYRDFEIGLNVYEIGCRVMYLDDKVLADLQEDGRSRAREYDIDRMLEESEMDASKYFQVRQAVEKRQSEKQAKENDYWRDLKKRQKEFEEKLKNRTRDELLANTGEFAVEPMANTTRQFINYKDELLIEQEILKAGGYRKLNSERTKTKQSLRTNTLRLKKKAEANIRAVECGKFGLGHGEEE
jgi:hypothetical protein